MASNKFQGDLGERFAEKFLVQKGYKIIERNFYCKVGEIDIIALDKDTLVFVEVKTRWSRKFGRPEEAVDGRKLAKIARSGEYFALENDRLPKKRRIDVVAVEVIGGKVKSAKLIKVT
jgi:putative endonuclease